jgi:hypothetical protein
VPDWRVANGSIPEVVERWLRDHVGVTVFRLVDDPAEPVVWILDWNCGQDEFDWPRADREPTLLEAIEIVMWRRG